MLRSGSLADNQVLGIDVNGSSDHFSFKGSGNTVIFHPDAISKGCSIVFSGSGGCFEVGTGAVVQGDFLISEQASIRIGANTNFNKRCVFKATKGRKIQLGQGCLLANVKFLTMDDLPVFDQLTQQRVNPAADVVVDDRVWIAEHVQIGAGAEIGHDTVIGAWSMVTGQIPAHCVAAGNPTQVVKTSVVWKK